MEKSLSVFEKLLTLSTEGRVFTIVLLAFFVIALALYVVIIAIKRASKNDLK